MAFAGGPRCGPLAIPLRRAWLASGQSCRRPFGGRMFEAAVLYLLRIEHSAGMDGIHSVLGGRRGSGENRFMVGGGRPKADHVGFWRRRDENNP